MRRTTLALFAAAASVTLTLTACGANSAPQQPASGPTEANSAAPAPGSLGKVGVVLPETKTSARWEGFDKPMLEKALRD